MVPVNCAVALRVPVTGGASRRRASRGRLAGRRGWWRSQRSGCRRRSSTGSDPPPARIARARGRGPGRHCAAPGSPAMRLTSASRESKPVARYEKRVTRRCPAMRGSSRLAGDRAIENHGAAARELHRQPGGALAQCGQKIVEVAGFKVNAHLAAESAGENGARGRQRDGGAAQVQYAAARLVAGGNLAVDRRAIGRGRQVAGWWKRAVQWAAAASLPGSPGPTPGCPMAAVRRCTGPPRGGPRNPQSRR